MKNTIASIFLYLLPVSFAFAQHSTERAFSGDPPDAHNPWAVHDRNRPQPPVVEPGARPGDPPSDAIILFDGTSESMGNWKHQRSEERRRADWLFENGVLRPQREAGDLMTVEEFGDIQLHIEWAAPAEVSSRSQGRGNSGVFFMGMVEVQILDSYENPTYPDGMAGAVYGLNPPAVNALRPPGEWQSYDIIFRRPIIREGVVLDPGSITILVNGVVVQDSTPLHGGGGHRERMPLDRAFPDQGPLVIQDHGNPVRFRNIWVRPLRPREIDGGTDGRLSVENTLRLRQQIAQQVLERAADETDIPRALLLMESLIYEPNDDVRREAEALISSYLEDRGALTKAGQQAEERRIRDLHRALGYLQTHGLVPPGYPLARAIESIAQENGWAR